MSVPDNLEQHAWKTIRIAGRAVSSHDEIGVGNVVLVVGAIGSIASLPARREHDLKTDTIFAVGIEVCLVRQEVAVQSTFGCLIVVKAVEADGTLSQNLLARLTQ